jgi:predicted alpha/beta hydrolase
MAYKTIQTQTLTVAKTDSIKRGFVKHFVDFIAKRGTATVAQLQREFTGKQFNNKKVTNERVVRYAYWCIANGVLKVAAQAKAAKAGAR